MIRRLLPAPHAHNAGVTTTTAAHPADHEREKQESRKANTRAEKKTADKRPTQPQHTVMPSRNSRTHAANRKTANVVSRISNSCIRRTGYTKSLARSARSSTFKASKSLLAHFPSARENSWPTMFAWFFDMLSGTLTRSFFFLSDRTACT